LLPLPLLPAVSGLADPLALLPELLLAVEPAVELPGLLLLPLAGPAPAPAPAAPAAVARGALGDAAAVTGSSIRVNSCMADM
jgi:hypothetical protein